MTIIIFLAVVVIYFAGMLLKNDTLQLIFKPIIISSLLVHFLVTTKNIATPYKKWITGALLFSIAGDTLLQFTTTNELFFLLGLSAFLIAHIFYIICFHQIKIKETIEGKWQWAVIVAIYYFFIISILLPHLGEMKIPVLVYGLVISFMLLVAMHLYDLEDNKTARYILTGALLFVASDSVLAINKFYHAFALGGWMIMVTYVGAQLMLLTGLVRLILKNEDEKFGR